MARTIELRQSDPVQGVADSVPCISASDLLEGSSDQLLDVVRQACRETGFFYVDASDSQRTTIANALDQMQRFFVLDDDDVIKRQVRQGASGDSGWVPRYTEPAYQPNTVSSLEAFDFAFENVVDPGSTAWPELQGFRSDVCKCWEDWALLAANVLRVIGQALALPEGFLERSCNSHALSTMRLLNYAPETLATDNDVGIAAHTDFECITLLYQTAAGLELLGADGHWLDAPVCEGRIVVLLDDMLEHWTNGEVKATGHRVRNTDEQRFSIVMFIAANSDIDISPLEQFVTRECPPRYATVTQEDHLASEIERANKNAEAAR